MQNAVTLTWVELDLYDVSSLSRRDFADFEDELLLQKTVLAELSAQAIRRRKTYGSLYMQGR